MSKKRKTIFTVTAMKFGYEVHLNRNNERVRHYRLMRERVWGWFSTEKLARQAVEENWTDMYEMGYYPHMLIEEVPEGVCMVGAKEFREVEWYKWQGSHDKGKYKPTTKPKSYKHTMGFSMG